tara:strand:+ start:1215 stop:2396 length:1182 start_codon:yes stop_codon:yes gene_type:complete
MKCKICGSTNISQVVDLGKQPLANKYPRNKHEIIKEKKFNLKIFFCKRCKACQIKKIVNRKILFEDYYYLSSVNKKLKEHFENLSFKLKKYNFVVDIGSNDGILLNPLKKLKINSIGIDPSKNVGEIANNKGLKTFIGFFDNRMIKKVLKEYQKPDLIVASSVVTHLKNPILFSKNIKKFLKKDGTLIIEIEYLQNFLKNIEYERFYFDRPFYYSANSIKKLFKNVRMKLYDIEKIDVHGGSLRFYIKNSLDCKITKRCEKILNNEKQDLNLHTFDIFNNKIHKHSKNLKDQLIKFNRQNKNVIGYGCPARVSTITNFSKINSNLIKYIIDDSPLKQNRFTPGMHIKILPRKNNLSNNNIIIVFAYEYFKDIKKIFKNKKVIFFKPIPFTKLL